MNTHRGQWARLALLVVVSSTASLGALLCAPALAATSEDLDRSAGQALSALYKTNPMALDISRHAKAALVFPNIVKAGLVFGGSYGEGELTEGAKVVAYYNSVGASWGLQAGAESFGYVVFLMNDE